MIKQDFSERKGKEKECYQVPLVNSPFILQDAESNQESEWKRFKELGSPVEGEDGYSLLVKLLKRGDR